MGSFFSSEYSTVSSVVRESSSDLYLIDYDIDNTSSVFSKLTTSNRKAFSQPSLICHYIDNAPKDKPIHVILTTHGGSLTSCEKILKKLLKHPAGYIAYIRQECYSAGAIIALGAKEIVMCNDSYMGKIDPQYGGGMEATKEMVIYATLEDKYITEKNIYDVIMAKRIMNLTNNLIDLIFDSENEDDIFNRKSVEEHLIYSNLPHCKSFSFEECQSMFVNKIRKQKPFEDKYFDTKMIIKDYIRKD